MAGDAVKILGFLSMVLAAYLLVCLLAFLFQRSLIYFPVRWSEAEARRWNPGCEEVRISVSDGERLHGWLHRREGAPWTVILFHGNAGNLSFHEATLAPFRTLGLQAILFDYRGYGLSTGRPAEEGMRTSDSSTGSTSDRGYCVNQRVRVSAGSCRSRPLRARFT